MIAIGAQSKSTFARSQNTRSVVRRLTCALVMSMALGACNSDQISAPIADKPDITLSNASSLASMFADDQARVIPTLPAGTRRAEMVTAMDGLSSALRGGSAVRVQQSLSSAKSSVDGYAPSLSGDTGFEADLDVLRLSMDVIEAQVIVDMLTGN